MHCYSIARYLGRSAALSTYPFPAAVPAPTRYESLRISIFLNK